MVVETVEKRTFNNFGFKFAIFNQSIKDSLKNTFGMNKQNKGITPAADAQVDETIRNVKNLKRFIETSHKSVKRIIKNMEETVDDEQILITLYSEEAFKECKDENLKVRYTSFADTFSKDYKELNKYISSLKNYEEWLDTFLNKVIKDTEDTIDECNHVRIEIQTYINCISSSKEDLKTEHPGYIEYERIKKIIADAEDLLEKSKARYEQLKVQLTEKCNMLELKRQVDLPNYLDSVQAALKLYHQSLNALYTPPSPPSLSPLPSPSLSTSTSSVQHNSKIEKIHSVNEDSRSIRSLPSSIPSYY